MHQRTLHFTLVATLAVAATLAGSALAVLLRRQLSVAPTKPYAQRQHRQPHPRRPPRHIK